MKKYIKKRKKITIFGKKYIINYLKALKIRKG